MNIFEHVRYRWNNFEIILAAEIISDVITRERKRWNDIKIISVFYFMRNHWQWLHVKQNTNLFQNYFKIFLFQM